MVLNAYGILKLMRINENSLIKSAQKAIKNAYAPYSNIKVGASLLTSTGKIYSGCNVENASYGLTICAERNAIGCAIAHGECNFVAIAIVNSTEKIITPCGACLQVIAEFSKNLKIICISMDGNIYRTDLSSLFPKPFDFPHLPKEKQEQK